MFSSFFPRPRFFFSSAVLWAVITIGFWYVMGRDFGEKMGLPMRTQDLPPPIGVSYFWSAPMVWFYLYFWAAVALFAAAWQLASPHRWGRWSILGSALILFVTYLQVQVSVAINNWYGPFYDLVQAALSHQRPVSLGEYYDYILIFARIALAAVSVGVLTSFFTSHYVFRWRTAMTDFYTEHWSELRRIEGAAQRVQEDTMRFASTTEDLGITLINSVMTLIAFLPVLVRLGEQVTELPLLGHVSDALVVAAVLWSLLGTLFLAAIGIRLPGLQFRNQRVEAAYRKELVYGEDDSERAQPPTLAELFRSVRKNYFRLYFHYTYFNLGRILYLQVDNVFGYIVLAPTIIAGAITLGVLQQILNAFDQVRSSFQYLVSSWTTIVELISIHKRLLAFEDTLQGHRLSRIEVVAA